MKTGHGDFRYNKDEQSLATKPSFWRFDLRRVYCWGWLNRDVRRPNWKRSSTPHSHFHEHKCCDSNTMSFRRKRDDWDEFLSRNHNAIALCGVPDTVIRDKLRFFVFLDHGYDEWGWAENNHAFFDSRIMTEDQIDRLAKLVGDNIDERYGRIIASRWMRNE